MNKSGILLIEQPHGWMLCTTNLSGPQAYLETADPSEIAKFMQGFATENRIVSTNVIITVASNSVLFAKIPESAAQDITNSQTLRFSLEAILPVDAEDIVADVIRTNSRQSSVAVSAVAMQVSHLLDIVSALEALQFKILFIAPTTLLAMEQAMEEKRIAAPSVSLWKPDQNEEKIEVVQLNSRADLTTWQVLDTDMETVRRSLALLDDNIPVPLLLGASDDRSAMWDDLKMDFRAVSVERLTLVKKRVEELLKGRREPWCDLRMEALAASDPWRRYRNSIGMLAIAVTIFLAVVCGTLFWKASQYREVVARMEKEQQGLFRSAFPDQKLPVAIQGRLKSEYTKALGIRKTDSSASLPISALWILHQAIASFDADISFTIEEARLESNRVSLEVTLESQQDAGRIASSLAGHGFKVEPPATTLAEGDKILASFTALFDQEKWKEFSTLPSARKAGEE